MALNACTLGGFNLHGRSCSDKFARLIPILHPAPSSQPIGTSNQSMRQGVHPEIERHWELENDERAPLSFEQPEVSVSVEILGFSGIDTQDVTGANVDFVSAHDFAIEPSNENSSIVVNITNLRIE